MVLTVWRGMSASIILASGSQARKSMLENAGVSFRAEVSRVDEDAIKQALLAENAKPGDVADTLAEYKAARLAIKYPSDLVIGSDQVLECEGKLFDKAKSLDEAEAKLKILRGKVHQLHSAAVIFEDGKPVWRTLSRAQLFMRNFSDAFLQEYLERHGTDVLQSVGCYFLEAEGAQLFTRVQGDYFTVLGFPLLDVLGFLRSRGALQE